MKLFTRGLVNSVIPAKIKSRPPGGKKGIRLQISLFTIRLFEVARVRRTFVGVIKFVLKLGLGKPAGVKFHAHLTWLSRKQVIKMGAKGRKKGRKGGKGEEDEKYNGNKTSGREREEVNAAGFNEEFPSAVGNKTDRLHRFVPINRRTVVRVVWSLEEE